MPKLRRLNGHDVRRILERWGFEVLRVKGSHHIMRRVIRMGEGEATISQTQTVTIPIHGSQAIAIGTLRAIVRSLEPYVSAKEIEEAFYTD